MEHGVRGVYANHRRQEVLQDFTGDEPGQEHDDFEAIAHAPADVAWLLAENKRVRGICTELAGAEEEWQATGGQDRAEKAEAEAERLLARVRELEEAARNVAHHHTCPTGRPWGPDPCSCYLCALDRVLDPD